MSINQHKELIKVYIPIVNRMFCAILKTRSTLLIITVSFRKKAGIGGENDLIFAKMMFISFTLFIFVLALMSIFRGYKGLKTSKGLEMVDRKTKIGYGIASAIHMWAGILIVLCYLVAVLLFFLLT